MALNTTDWYEYPSNFSNGTSVEGLGNFIEYSNVILNGQFGIGLLVIIWLTVFMASLMSGVQKALMTSSFIAFIFAIYLTRLDMIHPIFIFILIVLTIIGAIGSKQEQGL